MSKRWVRCCAVVMLGASCVFARSRAQDAGGAGEVKAASMMAADADPDWEVVTVKQSDPSEMQHSFMVQGRHVIIQNGTVERMLEVGYSLQGDQIEGAPDWVKTELFDVDGVPNVEGQPAVGQFQSLMRKLLVERFGLKMHMEKKEMGVYALTVAKGGPKVKVSASPAGTLPMEQMRNQSDAERDLEFRNVTLAEMTLMMSSFLDRPMVDQTGLRGRYDFKLRYTYDETKASTDGSAPPGLFTAVEEQLGLKLEATKAAADVLVIDKVEQPGAN